MFMEEENNGKVLKDIMKKIVKIFFKKWLVIFAIVFGLIVLFAALAWAQEGENFQDTSQSIRKGGKIKVKNEAGEEIELDVSSLNELVEKKGNSTTGYYYSINYLSEYIEKMLSEGRVDQSELGISKQKNLMEKMIMAELTTQYPDITKGYLTEVGSESNTLTDNFKGAINIKRISADDMEDASNENENIGLKDYLIIGDRSITQLKDKYKILDCEYTYAKEDEDVDYWVNKFDSIDCESPRGIIVSFGYGKNNKIKVKQLLDKLHEKYKDKKVPIYVIKTLHVGEKYEGANRSVVNSSIDSYNSDMESYCTGKGYNFIDTTEGLMDENGLLLSCTEDGINIDTFEANSKFYSNLVQAINEINSSQNVTAIENINANSDKIIDLKYISVEEFNSKIEQANNGLITYKEMMKYYTLDDQNNLIVAKWEYSNGKYSVSEGNKINYLNIVKKYTTPFEYLLAFLIDGQDENFIKDFVDLVFDTKITIMVMDEVTEINTTERTLVNTNGTVTYTLAGKSISNNIDKTSVAKTETKNEKVCSTKVEVTYVDSWFVKATSSFNYKKTDTGFVSQGIQQIGSENKEETVGWEGVADATFNGTKTTSTETMVQTIKKVFESGTKETKDNTDRICALFKNSECAKSNIMEDPSWLLDDLLAENENTADMIELTKYWLQRSTGVDFGVAEYDFSIYELKSIGGGKGGLLSITSTTLTKEEFVTAVQSYSGALSKGSKTETFRNGAETIYDVCVENNINPVLCAAQAWQEQNWVAPNTSPNNFWGIAVYNGQNYGNSYMTLEIAVKGYCNQINSQMNGKMRPTYEETAKRFATVNDNFRGDMTTMYDVFSAYAYIGSGHTLEEEAKYAEEYVNSIIKCAKQIFGEGALGGGEYQYYQGDYSDVPYGSGSLATCGCGPTSFAMVASMLAGKEITPKDAIDWCGNKYYVNGAGTSWSYFAAAANHFGVTSPVETTSTSQVVSALQSGKLVISSQGPGAFTKAGHYIVLSGIDSTGGISVKDPNKNNAVNKGYNDRKFTIQEINEAAKNYWIF